MKKSLIVLLTFLLLFGVASQCFALGTNNTGKVVSKFADMGNHWADEVVGKLIELGAIGGYGDGTFKPNKTITRAEFSKILNKTLDIPKSQGSAFDDTLKHWAKDDIYTLVQNNIIKKVEYGNKYDPDEKITRLEIAKMIVRAINLDEEAIAKTGQKTVFKDDKSIKPSDKGYIIVAHEKGLIGGYTDNTFKPNANATRAEASSMIVRTLKVITKNEEEIKEIPKEKEYVVADKLPKKTFEEENMRDVKNDISVNLEKIQYSPKKIVEVNNNLFPLKYEKIVIKSFEYVPYEKSFLKGTNEWLWGMGSPLDLFVVRADIINKHNTGCYQAALLDKNNKIIFREITPKVIEPGKENTPVAKKALNKYSYIPISNRGFDSIQSYKTDLMFMFPSKYTKEAKTLLFYYENDKTHSSDVIKIPIK